MILGEGDSSSGRMAGRVTKVRLILGQVAVAATPGDSREVTGGGPRRARPMAMEGREAADGTETAEGDIAIAEEGTGGTIRTKGHGMVPLVPQTRWRRL